MQVATRVLHIRDDARDELRQGIAQIQQEQGVDPAFPPEVEQAAEEAARNPRLPDLDLTDLPFVTIDPASAMDLDQAMHLGRDGDGYVVRYAIADLTAFITPGDPVDLEANRRGESLYGADSKIPLHPKVLSEDAASLLPDQVRPAFVWTLRLDSSGSVTEAKVERARVRSVAKLDYEGVQARGKGDDLFDLLQEIGELRIAQEVARGGVNLPMPEQEIVVDGDRWHLEFRSMLPVESWNAQISLMTGFAAAEMMISHRVGLLRTLPPPAPEPVERLRRQARALKVDWPAGEDYPAFIRRLDPDKPNEAAMVVACTALLRGAGYVGFEGQVPEQPEHSALASPYAHCTAPLRRLVDRYALEICACLCAGEEVPQWVRDKLGELPATMQESGRRAHAYENAVVNLAEAALLQGRVGEQFAAVVLEIDRKDPRRADIQLEQPAVEATATGDDPPVGEAVTATLVEADPPTRTVRFTI
jgi:exoribonuclease R